jgi:carboxyl-terminal processing protease
MVVATIPGGPSEKLGIRAGDKIVTIEDEDVAGIGLKNSQVKEKLMGDKGTKVRVEVKRKRSNNIDFVITRDAIPVNSVDAAYMVSDNTGYIKLNMFSRTSMREVDKAMRELKASGMINLIFDLQGNGGGLLYTAKHLADEFLSGNKLIVYSEGRTEPKSELKAGNPGSWESGKLILLTDEHSASASEILSGAVQDWDRGLIVGRRTYGKGLVQRPIDLTDGSQMRLTIARYYTPSGRFIQKSYEDMDEYRNDLINRYENGEFMNQDSIKFPDSLMYKTLLAKRTVYGGGGVMPDFFVPLDTTERSDLFSDLLSGGHLNNFCLTYSDNHREDLHTRYSSFNEFNQGFFINQSLIDELMEFAASEDEDFEFNEQEYKISEKLLKLRLKASLANNLWGIHEFYQVYNESNEILQAAIEIIESEKYEEAGLSPVE